MQTTRGRVRPHESHLRTYSRVEPVPAAIVLFGLGYFAAQAVRVGAWILLPIALAPAAFIVARLIKQRSVSATRSGRR